jgi:TonB family protein
LTAELPGTVAAVRVPLWVLVDRWGRVDSVRVDSSAALEENLDSLLALAARELRFMPWEKGPAWTLVHYPIAWQNSAEDKTARPAFTPFTTCPELKNRRQVQEELVRGYPSHLRDAGVGGKTTLWAFIDTTGAVVDLVAQQSSGSRELDEAAERLAWKLEFTPALNRGRRVPVWVSIPVVFTVSGGWVSEQPPPEFILGPRHDPVAEATLKVPDELDALPDLVRPDEARERLSRAYLDSGPAEDLGLLVTLHVGRDGGVQPGPYSYRVGGAERYESTIAAIYSELERLRFRPGMLAGEPHATTFSAWLVFSRYLGLAPSLPSSSFVPVPLTSRGCAGADSLLLSGPQFSPTDQPPELATPEWERARLIRDTWPISLQRKRESYEFRFWLLLDNAGRVCEAQWLGEPEDPWVAGKARQIVRRLRFTPPTLASRTVAAWYAYALAFSFAGR